MYCVPCEDKIRYSREEVESRELLLQDPPSPWAPNGGTLHFGALSIPPQCSCSYVEDTEAPVRADIKRLRSPT